MVIVIMMGSDPGKCVKRATQEIQVVSIRTVQALEDRLWLAGFSRLSFARFSLFSPAVQTGRLG